MSNPNYYAVIPAKVRYDKNLKANEKLLYAEITALCNAKGYCFATNNYFAEIYSTSTRSISSYVSNLQKKGFIKVTIIKNEKKQVVQRRITIEKNFVSPQEENFVSPQEENFQYNNTRVNNTSKKNIYKKKHAITAEEITELREFAKEKGIKSTFLDYFIRQVSDIDSVYYSKYIDYKKALTTWANKSKSNFETVVTTSDTYGKLKSEGVCETIGDPCIYGDEFKYFTANSIILDKTLLFEYKGNIFESKFVRFV